ncbi:MAG: DUF4340 domain-containing protein [Planctomycetota bacterium]|nr:DUF4340 domain-containing protein [Planctomycetota bacterium]
MNFKTTIILICLLVVVGGAVWWTERGGSPSEPATQQPTGAEGRKLLDLAASRVNRISITDATGKRTSVEKTGGQWRMTDPVDAPAVDYSVRDLIGQVTEIRSHGQPSTDPGADSGLDKPTYVIELGSDDGKATRVVLGNKTGVGDMMYARLGDGDINLVDANIDKALKTAADDVRDKHLLTIKDADVKQFRVTSGDKTLAGARIGGKWRILEPVALPGDEASISSMISSLTSLTATEYVKSDSPDLALAQFNRPTARVWLSSDAPTTQPATTVPSNPTGGSSLVLGAPDSLARDHYFVQLADGQAAKIAGNLLDAFKRTPLELRDKDVASIAPADVTKISILKEVYPPPATQPAMREIATTLTSTTKVSVAMAVPEKPKPASSQTILLMKRAEPAPAMLGPTLAVPPTQPSTGPTTLASTRPATMPAEPVSQWLIDGDATQPADDAKVVTLLGKFQPLHIEKYVEHPADSTVARHYVITLTTQPAGGQGSVNYQVDVTKYAADAQNPVATYNGLTFELPATFLDALDADFHSAKK